MSYYNHMHDSNDSIKVCSECDKKFSWTVEMDIYPGGKDTEYIECPYCNTSNGSVRTSGFVFIRKIDD